MCVLEPEQIVSKYIITFQSEQHLCQTSNQTGEEAVPIKSEDYIYAKVIPRHLRQDGSGSMPASISAGIDQIPRTQPQVQRQESNVSIKLIDRVNSISKVSCISHKPTNGEHTECSLTPSMLNLSKQSSQRVARPQFLGTVASVSETGFDSISKTPNTLESGNKQFKHFGNQKEEISRPGHYIRKFVKEVINDKQDGMFPTVNIFLECIKTKSDQDSYGIMQATRQFITGLTNCIFETRTQGLSAAVEKEQLKLNGLGFINVSSLIETTIQRYVLRYLHQQIIQLLKEEQIKANELGPLRTAVQLACLYSQQKSIMQNTRYLTDFGFPNSMILPPDVTVQSVKTLFRQMEVSYSVSEKSERLVEIFEQINREAIRPEAGNSTDRSNDLHAVYAWTLARAGVLLAPIISLPNPSTNNTSHSPTMSFYSPAALQADYLNGLASDSQLGQLSHSNNHCALTDLFGTLQWVWTRHSELSLPQTPCGSFDMPLFDLARSDNVQNSDKPKIGNHENSCLLQTGRPSDTSKNLNSGNKWKVTQCSEQNTSPEKFMKKEKRRLLSVRRRKTIAVKPNETTIDDVISKGKSNIQTGALLKSARPVEAAESENQAHTKYTWRPWMGRMCCNGEIPVVRVVVMDERTNQIRVHTCVAKPNLTVGDLSQKLAIKMQVCDPQNFRLYLWTDNKEYRLQESCNLLEIVESQQTTSENLTGGNSLIPDKSTVFGSIDIPVETQDHAIRTRPIQSLFSHFRLFGRRKNSLQMDYTQPISKPSSSVVRSEEVVRPITYAGPSVIVYRRMGSLFAISSSALTRALIIEVTTPSNSI